MKIIYRLLPVLLFLGILSCKSLNNSIEKNKKKAVEVFEAAVNNNGNAFSIGSANTNFSYVWSYTQRGAILYKLVDGKVIDEIEYSGSSNQWLDKVPHKPGMVFTECYELDGDYIKYEIRDGNNRYEDILPVNLNCFLNKSKDDEFYEILAGDIKKYGISW